MPHGTYLRYLGTTVDLTPTVSQLCDLGEPPTPSAPELIHPRTSGSDPNRCLLLRFLPSPNYLVVKATIRVVVVT